MRPIPTTNNQAGKWVSWSYGLVGITCCRGDGAGANAATRPVRVEVHMHKRIERRIWRGKYWGHGSGHGHHSTLGSRSLATGRCGARERAGGAARHPRLSSAAAAAAAATGGTETKESGQRQQGGASWRERNLEEEKLGGEKEHGETE